MDSFESGVSGVGVLGEFPIWGPTPTGGPCAAAAAYDAVGPRGAIHRQGLGPVAHEQRTAATAERSRRWLALAAAADADRCWTRR